VPGQSFDASKLDPAVAKGIAEAPKPAQDKIMRHMKEGLLTGDFRLDNGWFFTTKAGLYGTNYLQRALITAIVSARTAPRMRSTRPPKGRTSSRSTRTSKYVMRFEKGKLPPSTASGR